MNIRLNEAFVKRIAWFVFCTQKSYTVVIMDTRFISHSPENTAQFGADLAAELTPGLLTLSGELGAGKTKLTAGILSALGAEGPYQSPTFMLVKEYHLAEPTKTGIERIYHADAYRLEPEDFETLGFQTWFEDKEALVILEWPEKIEKYLPEKRISITLKQTNETEREFLIHHHE
jgi:tRNA threonylcarbamoyladenosine biosynthesis protein TsaE